MFFILKIWNTIEIFNFFFTEVFFISLILFFMGFAILFFWFLEIKRNFSFLKLNQFNWRNKKNENMWFHVSAELITALFLIIAGVTTILSFPIAKNITLFSAGLLFYASLNSLSWVFAEKSRFKLAFPMIGGVLSSIFICLYYLI